MCVKEDLAPIGAFRPAAHAEQSRDRLPFTSRSDVKGTGAGLSLQQFL